MLQVRLGTKKNSENEELFWRPAEIANAHGLIIGDSGVGKTFRLRDIIAQLAQYPVRIYVFDVHSDLNLPDEICSTVKFSETTLYGINPLAINPDPDNGGVNRRINTFISMIQRYSRVMGERQIYALSQLLQDFYAENGYDASDPSSWNNGQSKPTFLDFKNFAKKKIRSFAIGNSGKVHRSLGSLCGKMRQIDREKKKKPSEQDEAELLKLREECKTAYCAFIDALEAGDDIDDYFLKYDSIEVMKSVYKRIENLYNLGIFREKSPVFDRNCPVWRFDIFNLTNEGRGFLVELYLEKVLQNAKRSGIKSNGEPHSIIFLDESHLFFSPDYHHIISRIVREGRKFGLSIWLSSQSHSDFSELVFTGCGTTMILGLHEQYYQLYGKRLGIKAGRFFYIRPRKTGLVQMKTLSADINSRFVDVIF